MSNYRKIIIDELIPYFRQDSRYYLLVGDMGFGAIDKLKAEFPDRVINCGIMEQGTVGIAAGISMSGLIPICYTIVNFLVYRALEQVRNDVVIQQLNVKFIATGVNDYFSMLGDSHCCGEDDIKLMQLINMEIFNPYANNFKFSRLVKNWLTSNQPGYIRV